jgi:hypothetical protein
LTLTDYAVVGGIFAILIAVLVFDHYTKREK